jgi:NitT/TauT family transport system permease protein
MSSRRAAVARQLLPVAVVLAALLLLWLGAAVGLNARGAVERVLDPAGTPWGWRELVAATWAMERPVLPAPQQVAAEIGRAHV